MNESETTRKPLPAGPAYPLPGSIGSPDYAPGERRAPTHVPGAARRSTTPEARRSAQATAHLLAAIEVAGPEREAIRGSLCEMRRIEIARLEAGEWRLSTLRHR